MEFPQSTNEEEGEGTDLDGLRSVLVRVYSSHIHENREDGKLTQNSMFQNSKQFSDKNLN